MDEIAQQQTGKTRLSITEAASLASVNRTYFYEKFLHPKLIEVHKDERNKKYIELVELLRVTGPLKKKISDSAAGNAPDNKKQQNQTLHATNPDNNTASETAQVLQVKLEALNDMLRVKEEMLRMKDEQLNLAEAREQFYQDELRAVRFLAAPQIDPGVKSESKRRKWLFGLI